MKKLFFPFLAVLLLGAACSNSSSVDSSDTPAESSSDLPVVAEPDATLPSIVSSKYVATSDATWGCHDPKIWQDTDGKYYVFSTGWQNGVQQRVSSDLVNWTKTDLAITEWDSGFQNWVKASEGSWAPTIHKQDGKYYMFHGIITGNQPDLHACITLAISDSVNGPFKPAVTYDSTTYTNSSLVRYSWNNTQSGYESTYNTANNNWKSGYGAIDPEFIYDIATGELVEYTVGSTKCYGILYGSWKGGVAVIFVDAATFKPVCTKAGTSAFNNITYSVGDVMDAPADSISGNQGIRVGGGDGAAYEGAQLLYNSDTNRYYLFVSMGELTYEYRVGVGRSDEVTEFTPEALPTTYLDPSGRNMNAVVDTKNNTMYYHNVGGKIIGAQCLDGEYGFTSPGGLSVYRDNAGKILFANHARTNYMASWNFMLQIHQLFFNDDGWPVLNQNDFYNDYADLTADGTESLTEFTQADVVGNYSSVLTVRTSTVGTVSNYDNNTGSYSIGDATAAASKTVALRADGTISGEYSGTWQLDSDGYSITLNLKTAGGSSLGTFKGYVLHAVDWARKTGSRRTITFTTVDGSSTSGEYFWGNKVSDTADAPSLWTITDSAVSYSGTATALTLPTLSVTASEGFTVEFTLNDTLSNYSNNDWATKLLSYKNCHVTVPNLDPWSNTVSESTLTGKNCFPTADGATLEAGYEYTFPWGAEYNIKITFSADEIVWYRNGSKVLTYGSGVFSGAGVAEFVGYYVTGLASGEVVFNAGGMNISNLAISKGIN